MTKNPKRSVSIFEQKTPRVQENAEAFYDAKPSWLFNRNDLEYCWSENNNVCDATTLYSKVLPFLSSLESMTWREIFSATGGRRAGTNHHPITTEQLCKQAKERLEHLKIFEDELVSLRTGNTLRIWGIRSGATLRLLWYDPEHRVYPVSR